jgi:hypothetical protein
MACEARCSTSSATWRPSSTARPSAAAPTGAWARTRASAVPSAITPVRARVEGMTPGIPPIGLVGVRIHAGIWGA